MAVPILLAKGRITPFWEASDWPSCTEPPAAASPRSGRRGIRASRPKLCIITFNEVLSRDLLPRQPNYAYPVSGLVNRLSVPPIAFRQRRVMELAGAATPDLVAIGKG